MKIDIVLRWIVVSVLTMCFAQAHADTYPEFNGNYIACKTGWCKFDAYQLKVMGLWQPLKTSNGTRGSNLVVYAGFVNVPKAAPILSERQPRFLTFSGRVQSDPSTVALVELAPLPYDDAPIDEWDGEKYEMQIHYRADTIKSQLWTFKRELSLRYKPVEGKTGMFVFQPSQPLTDGFYVIDSGLQQGNEHSNLDTMPAVMGFYKYKKPQTGIPFIVGDPKQVFESGMGRNSDSSNSIGVKTVTPGSTREQQADEVGKAVDNLFKGLFKRE